MQSSEKLDELTPALVATLRDLKNPAPDTKGQVRGKADYKYLSLPKLLEVIRASCRSTGLGFVQEVVGAPNGVGVTTRIVHLSGQWLETGPLVLPVTGGPQDFGSAMTYARRYALAAAFGLAAEEDDDAARVSGGGAQRPHPRNAGASPDAGQRADATASVASGGEASATTPSGVDSPSTAAEGGEGEAPPNAGEDDYLLPEGNKYHGHRVSAIARADPEWLKRFIGGMKDDEKRTIAERWLAFHKVSA